MRDAISASLMLVCLVAGTVRGASQTNASSKSTTYEVEFVFDGTTYSGTMALSVSGEAVSGTMRITTPVPVTGTVAGTEKGGKLALAYPFSMGGDQPCDGHVTVDATMDAKTGAASGTTRETGCSDEPLNGTFALKPAAADKGKTD